MNKFKVGDLITDKSVLYQVVAIDENTYTLKIIIGVHQGKIASAKKDLVEKNGVAYDLSKPLTKMVNNGVCECRQCFKELHYGDDCVRDDYHIYCSEECLVEHLAEHGTIDENDLDDSSTIEKPLFELSEEQLKLIEGYYEQRT